MVKVILLNQAKRLRCLRFEGSNVSHKIDGQSLQVLQVLGIVSVLLMLSALEGLESTLGFLKQDLTLLKLLTASCNVAVDIIKVTPESFRLVAQRGDWVKAPACAQSQS